MPDLLQDAGDPEILRGTRDYRDVLALLHARLRPALYLEIGVRKGESLRRATGRAIGIDPLPEVEIDLPHDVVVHATTSDAYFAADPPPGLDAPVDFAFIDGMHLFEFALRDFINVERHAAPWGLIAIDDVLPGHPQQALRERQTRAWMGDVWKLVDCLQRHRPDLTLQLLDTWPGGMLLVSGLDPRSTVLADRYDTLLAEAAALPEAPPADRIERTGIAPANDDALVRLCDELRARRAASADQ
jgi:hypothetical protein